MEPLRDLSTARIIDALYAFRERQTRKGAVIRLPHPFDASFPVDDTGLGSLDAAELAVFMENRFGVELDFVAFLRSKTLGDVVSVVSAGIGR